MKKIVYAISLLALLAVANPAFAACTDISVDIGSGSTDKTSASNVTKLQTFLKEAGYLQATPNGVFGPATLAAAKKFQSIQGVNATGFVGPLTRTLIKIKSCPSVTTPSTPVTPTLAQIKNPIITPKEGAIVTIGKPQIIRWTTELKSPYSIILEDAQGVSVGYIVITRLDGTEFEWKAGDVYSTESQSNKVVPPGSYKIRIRGTYGDISTSDPQSSVFTLESQPVTANMVYPRLVSTGDGQSIVLYGSGFNDQTAIYIDGSFNIRTTKLYTSPDGRTLVFTAPKDLAAGSHSLWGYNGNDVTELGLNFTAI